MRIISYFSITIAVPPNTIIAAPTLSMSAKEVAFKDIPSQIDDNSLGRKKVSIHSPRFNPSSIIKDSSTSACAIAADPQSPLLASTDSRGTCDRKN